MLIFRFKVQSGGLDGAVGACEEASAGHSTGTFQLIHSGLPGAHWCFEPLQGVGLRKQSRLKPYGRANGPSAQEAKSGAVGLS